MHPEPGWSVAYVVLETDGGLAARILDPDTACAARVPQRARFTGARYLRQVTPSYAKAP